MSEDNGKGMELTPAILFDLTAKVDALTPWAKFRGQARLAEIVLTHGGDHGD